MKLISVSILNFKQGAFLKDCIASILAQSYKNIEIIITDNDSADGSAEFIKKEYPNITVIENSINTGYAKAHNEFMRASKGEFLLFLNADIVLDNFFIEKMVNAIEKDKRTGMVQGKLYRMQAKGQAQKTLDSAGIILCKNRRNLDEGFGRKDSGQYSSERNIFGASGAALFCRRDMLEDIKINGEYFDEDFFAYREEADLAWRAQLAGWKCIYVPQAVAYHYRAYSPDRRIIMPKNLRRLQYRNRYLMLIKNELPFTFILHLPYILAFEFISFCHTLFREPFLFKTWPEIIRLLPKMLQKRKVIMRKKRVSYRYILSMIK